MRSAMRHQRVLLSWSIGRLVKKCAKRDFLPGRWEVMLLYNTTGIHSPHPNTSGAAPHMRKTMLTLALVASLGATALPLQATDAASDVAPDKDNHKPKAMLTLALVASLGAT